MRILCLENEVVNLVLVLVRWGGGDCVSIRVRVRVSRQDEKCPGGERGAVSETVSAEWDALHVLSALLTLIHMNN